MVPPDADVPDPLWIFNEPSVVPTDRLPDLGPDIVSSSIRTIAATGQYAVYVAQNRQDEYCLIVSDVPPTGWSSACDDAERIRSEGLWIGAMIGNPESPGGSSNVEVTWGVDGSFTFQPANPR